MCFLNRAGGRVTYSGPALGLRDYAARTYFEADMGVPPVANAPEVFLELCDQLIADDRLHLVIVDTVQNHPDGEAQCALSIDDDYVTANNFFYETYIICSRNLENIIRTKELFGARIGSAIGFSILIGSVFYRRPETDVGVSERVAYLVFTIAFFCYTCLDALPIFLSERDVFEREYSRGAYRAISYVTAITIVQIPFLLIMVLVYAIPSYYMVMLPNEAETFFFYIFTLVCTLMASEAFAVLISALVPDPMAGQTIGSALLSVMFLLSGFFITANNIPDWWIWLHCLSIFKYPYESLTVNFLLDKIETPTSTNAEIMERFSVQNISKWRGIGVLLGMVVFFRLIFYAKLMRSFNGRRRE